MGLSLGAASGGTTSSATGSGVQNNTYAPGQTNLQGQTGSYLSQALSAASNGTLTPGVTAGETQADNQINQTAAGTTSRVDQMLAARGFGPSGKTGQATLQGELGREAGIGNEAGVAQGQQQNLNSSNLLAALNYAFTSLGSSSSGQSSGSGSSWGVGAGVGGTPAQFASAFS